MTLLFADGFEINHTTNYNNWFFSGSMAREADLFYSRTKSTKSNVYLRIQVGNNDYSARHSFSANSTSTVTLGFAFMIDRSNPGNAERALCRFDASSNPQCSVIVVARGSNRFDLSLRRFSGYNNTYPALATTTTAPVYGFTWHYLETQVFIHDTLGTCIMHLDGEEVLNATGLDTRYDNDTLTQFVIGADGNWHADEVRFDDVYLCDTSGTECTGFLGTVVVENLIPTGTGLVNNFIGSDGNSVDNHLHVDDNTPDGDSSYVQSSGLGDIDSYQISNITNPDSNIHGIHVVSHATKVGTGSVTGLAVTEINGVFYSGVEPYGNLSQGSYGWRRDSFCLDPSTGSGWTYSGLENTQIGTKIIG